MNLPLITTRLRLFYDRNHRLPTYGEMCKLLNYKSKGAVRYVVQRLIKEGILEKDEAGILIPKDLYSIPMYGSIKAGSPTQIEVQQDKNLNLHLLLSKVTQQSFALTISGDSMIDEGIYDGDIVIVTKDQDLHNGDVVAACIDNEWTVKYFQKLDGQVVLLPANKKYKPIYPKISLEIGGVVTHVIRNYR